MKRSLLLSIISMLFTLTVGCTTDDFLNDEYYFEITKDTTYKSTIFSYDAEVFAIIQNLGAFGNHSFQGFATFGDIAFGFYESGLCRSIDLNKKEIIAEFALPNGVNHKRNHAGVACFSNEFLSEKDEFPLLYLSSYQERKCYVLNMTTKNAELIQTIITVDSLNGNKIQDVWAYEPDGDVLLLKMNYKDDNDSGYNWVSIKKPSISTSPNIILDINNKIDEFHTHSTAKYNAGFVLNGYIYQLAGYTRTSRKLFILDYINKRTIVDVTWNNPIINDQEQEQCTRYKDGILINYNKSDKLVYVKFNNWIF